MGGGRAGQLLRLVSFDALLRKLQFDFSDTFGKGFYFDSIRSTARLKDGIMHTDNLLIDGPAADIAMSGQIDLARRRIDMEAVVAPAISATVGARRLSSTRSSVRRYLPPRRCWGRCGARFR